MEEPIGPISRKVVAALKNERRRRVIDFSALKLGAERAEALERGVISEADLQASRMGLYVHEGVEGAHVMLREFVTGTKYRCISPAGYMGKPGEIWFARILPEPFESQPMGYSLVFNTPYVIGRFNGRFAPADPREWQAFLDRTIPKTGIADAADAYAHLLKYGLSRNYWNDYVMDAYVNHQHDMIMLAGFPDVPASLPHSRESGR